MALIKSHSAAEVVNGAVVLDLGDLRRQGEVLRQRAQAEAGFAFGKPEDEASS